MIPACAFTDDVQPYLGDDPTCVGTVVDGKIRVESGVAPCQIEPVNNGTHLQGRFEATSVISSDFSSSIAIT